MEKGLKYVETFLELPQADFRRKIGECISSSNGTNLEEQNLFILFCDRTRRKKSASHD